MAAYAIIFILLMIMISGSSYIVSTVFMNEFITVMNGFIADGTMSNQFITFWKFVLGAFTILPVLLLIAFVIWGYVRAIERRNEQV